MGRPSSSQDECEPAPRRKDAAKGRLEGWLPKLSHPVRIGEHDQTAFALGLVLDYARAAGDAKFTDLLVSKARQFYLGDKDCPLAYEPSGKDFLSPCLGEADLMRRVLPGNEFARWLRSFLPQISPAKNGSWLQPVVSPDPGDPKLAHLDGLNLSRAWTLEGIAAGLPKRGQTPADIVPEQVLAPLLGDQGSFVIRPCNGADCVNRIPEHHCGLISTTCNTN